METPSPPRSPVGRRTTGSAASQAGRAPAADPARAIPLTPACPRRASPTPRCRTPWAPAARRWTSAPSSTRVSSRWFGSASSLRPTAPSRNRFASSTLPSVPRRRPAPAGIATTAMAMAIAPAMGARGRHRDRAPGISGRSLPANVASTTSQTATPRPRSPCSPPCATARPESDSSPNRSGSCLTSHRLRSAHTQPDGTFSLTVPVTGGTTGLNVVAISSTGTTAHARRAVVFDFTPGTVLLDVTDPSGDDNGPGNYAYPTSDNFHAGAFDVLDFRVIESPDGSTTTFKLQVRDLSPTFGSPLGAQLVDVYVHNPVAAASDQSTAASFPQRNYIIYAAAAWGSLIDVQAFGPRYVGSHGP